MDLGVILEERRIANWTSLINFGRKTRCDLLRRWDVNHCNANRLTPNLVLRWFNDTPWSTVWNAALKSSNTRRVTRWESKFIRMSFCTFKSAVSVLWHLQYADWNEGYKPCDVKCACVWSKTAHSVNYETCRIGATWCRLVQLGVVWCNLVQISATWCRLVQLGADCYNLVQLDSLWGNLVQIGAT